MPESAQYGARHVRKSSEASSCVSVLSDERLFRFFALVMLILATALYGILAIQAATTRIEQDRRLTSWKLADSLRLRSDDLTNLARSYVST